MTTSSTSTSTSSTSTTTTTTTPLELSGYLYTSHSSASPIGKLYRFRLPECTVRETILSHEDLAWGFSSVRVDPAGYIFVVTQNDGGSHDYSIRRTGLWGENPIIVSEGYSADLRGGLGLDRTNQKVYFWDNTSQPSNVGLNYCDYDGGNLTRIIAPADIPDIGIGWFYAIWNIAVDPTGGKIYFWGSTTVQTSIYMADLDGGNVTNLGVQILGIGNGRIGPVLDLANSYIYYTTVSGNSVDLYRMDLDGSNKTLIDAGIFQVRIADDRYYLSQFAPEIDVVNNLIWCWSRNPDDGIEMRVSYIPIMGGPLQQVTDNLYSALGGDYSLFDLYTYEGFTTSTTSTSTTSTSTSTSTSSTTSSTSSTTTSSSASTTSSTSSTTSTTSSTSSTTSTTSSTSSTTSTTGTSSSTSSTTSSTSSTTSSTSTTSTTVTTSSSTSTTSSTTSTSTTSTSTTSSTSSTSSSSTTTTTIPFANWFYDEFDDQSIDGDWTEMGSGTADETVDGYMVLSPAGTSQKCLAQTHRRGEFDFYTNIKEHTKPAGGYDAFSGMEILHEEDPLEVRLHLYWYYSENTWKIRLHVTDIDGNEEYVWVDLGTPTVGYVWLRLKYEYTTENDQYIRAFYSLASPELSWTEVTPTTVFPRPRFRGFPTL